ncbi:MAG: T9SS type A sorting domain-containing protein [Candidatus Odinarchaeota archaeon]
MKRLFISVLLITLLQIVLLAQEYYPFDTSNVVWNELKESSMGDTYPPNKIIETFYISGDTIIDNHRFHRIFIDGFNYSTYVGSFREENKKVYYIGVDYFGFESDSVVLLYDFSKHINDTIYTGTWHRVVIEDIDSILVGNAYRKKYHMDDGQCWIEGIGSTFGFLFPMTDIPTMYWKSELICYKHNDSLLYLNPDYLDCFTEKKYSIINTNTTWYTYIYIYCCWQFDTEVITIGQDTNVNDVTYSTVWRATGGDEIPDQFYGLIREDSSQRIYYRTSYDKSEKLLYDFGISEKDTIAVYGLTDRSRDYYDECKYVCDSIRDGKFFDIQRKVIHLTAIPDPVPEKWIEGIGSTTGLLHHWDGRVGGDAFYLSCVKSQDGFLFRKSESEPCIKTNSGIVKNKSDDILIFPNPIGKNHVINIKNIPIGSTIEVYDVIGKLVHRHFLDFPEVTITINVTSGIYLYKLIDRVKGNIQTGKLIFE